MRDLTSKINTLKLYDSISQSTITVFYALPTTTQRVAYHKNQFKRANGKVEDNTYERSLNAGLEIITGFADGDFAVDGKPVSSNPDKENYYPEWKELIKKSADDIVVMFAQIVFEGVKPYINYFDDKGDEETLPLAKSSGDGLTAGHQSENEM